MQSMQAQRKGTEVEDEERYDHGDVECIDAIKAALTDEEYRGFCKGNVIKYVWREKYKGGNKDMKKAKDYIDYACDGCESSPLYMVIDLLTGQTRDGGAVAEVCTNPVRLTLSEQAAKETAENERLKPYVITSCVYEIPASWIRYAFTGDASCIEDF